MVLERFAVDHFVRIIIFKFKWIFRFRAAVLDLGDVGKSLGHRRVSLGWPAWRSVQTSKQQSYRGFAVTQVGSRQ